MLAAMASLQVIKYGFMSKTSWRSFCGQEGQGHFWPEQGCARHVPHGLVGGAGLALWEALSLYTPGQQRTVSAFPSPTASPSFEPPAELKVKPQLPHQAGP